METKASRGGKFRPGGLAGWLTEKLRRKGAEERHLTLVERIALAPKQSLVLVEAEGHRLLVAFSAEGAPVFHALDKAAANASRADGVSAARSVSRGIRRISW